jgi:two-component system, sensor histidine kinase and response regulator
MRSHRYRRGELGLLAMLIAAVSVLASHYLWHPEPSAVDGQALVGLPERALQHGLTSPRAEDESEQERARLGDDLESAATALHIAHARLFAGHTAERFPLELPTWHGDAETAAGAHRSIVSPADSAPRTGAFRSSGEPPLLRERFPAELPLAAAALLLLAGAPLLWRRAHPAPPAHSGAGPSGPLRLSAAPPAAAPDPGPADAGPTPCAFLLASMSHEIRAPVTAVLGAADLLATEALSEEQQEYVRGLRTSAETLLAVVDSFLDFARLEHAPAPQCVPFDLEDVLESVLDVLAHPASAKDIELAAIVEPGAGTAVRGDPQRLRQVLINLTANAVKYTERGEVVLRVRPHASGSLELSVCDTGIGIPAHAHTRLFEPFFQVNPQADRRHGVGLGLAICRAHLQAMGGTIELSSEPGRGSTFRVVLPLHAQPMPPQSSLAGRRVLIVACQRTLAELLRLSCAGWGMHAAVAHSVSAARSVLQAATAAGEPYDCAVVDAQCSDQAALRALRGHGPFHGVPLVVLCRMGAACAQHQDLAALEPAVRLLKPLSRRPLQAALVRVLDAADKPIDGAAQPSAAPRVLVADDNPVSRQLLVRMLESLGSVADAVPDGSAALAAVARRGYDLVLMDVQMPGMDGYAAAKEIHRRRPHVPVVAVTAAPHEGHQQRWRQAGMTACLVRPLRRDQLAELLARWSALNRSGVGAAPAPPIDPAVWAKLCEIEERGSGHGFLDGLIDLFLEDARGRVQLLAAARGTGDRCALERQAHTLRSGCCQIGAMRMVRICERIEAIARARAPDWGDVPLEALEQELESVAEALHVRRPRRMLHG